MNLSHFHESDHHAFSLSQSLRCPCSTAMKGEGSVFYRGGVTKTGHEVAGGRVWWGLHIWSAKKYAPIQNLWVVSFFLLFCYFCFRSDTG